VWAEKSFFESFEHVGACACTEEQIAYANYRGGQVMKSVPAYTAEEIVLDKTCNIERVPFGMESRFWYAGKEIPDYPKLIGIQTQSDQTPVERILYENDVPISEFVLQSYVRNALHMGEFNITKIIDTIAPPAGTLKRVNVEYLATYLLECLDDFRKTYTPLAEKIIGPARQRACELHTAVIELAYSLHKGHIDRSWLPRHVFILLSQIQTHTACLLEELNVDNEKEVAELHAIDSTLDNMIETYEDLKDSLKKAMDNFRHSNLSLVKTGASVQSPAWRTIQISIGGASVWRRIVLPADTTLVRLRSVISAVFDWSGEQAGRFIAQGARSQRILDMEKNIRMNETLSSLNYEGVNEFVYEYNVYWTIAIINLSNYEPGNGEQPRCVAGEGVAPPEVVEGPLRLRRYQNALENGIIAERQQAEKALGEGYADALFNIEHCNQKLRGIYA
jgi:hypothetical protein